MKNRIIIGVVVITLISALLGVHFYNSDEINDSKDDNYYTDTDASQDFLMDMDDIDLSKESLEVNDNPLYTEDEFNEIYEDMEGMDILGDNKP